MESFEGPTSSESKLVAGLEKKRKCRSVEEGKNYIKGVFLFWCLTAWISFIIVLNSSHPPHKAIPPVPSSCSHSLSKSRSLYGENFPFDLHALLRENETDLEQESEILWTKRGLTYGDLQSVHRFITNVSIPEVSGTEESAEGQSAV